MNKNLKIETLFKRGNVLTNLLTFDPTQTKQLKLLARKSSEVDKMGLKACPLCLCRFSILSFVFLRSPKCPTNTPECTYTHFSSKDVVQQQTTPSCLMLRKFHLLEFKADCNVYALKSTFLSSVPLLEKI